MKIGSYSIEQQSISQYQKVEKREMSIEIQQTQDQLDISDQGLTMSEVNEEPEDFLSEKDKRKIELLEKLLTWFTGKEFKFNRVSLKDDSDDSGDKVKIRALSNRNRRGRRRRVSGESGEGNQVQRRQDSDPQGSNVAMRFHASHEVYESEKMTFSSKGSIQTEDGKSIEFDYNLSLSRETYERSEINLEVGVFHDPLVLNFDGKGVDFGDDKLQIDIDLDGNLDNVNFLSQGSGFLALDRNNNGLIDDGSELFGPRTNSGFGELAEFDEDSNGWIDENDEIYSQLRVWTLDENNEATLIGLKDADVGAIYLGNVEGKYTIKHGDEDMAKIKGSSIYLTESGKANVIHEVDLKL